MYYYGKVHTVAYNNNHKNYEYEHEPAFGVVWCLVRKSCATMTEMEILLF